MSVATPVLAILAASLLGSVHCAAMCGGFVCLYAGTGSTRHVGVRPHAAYNVGRLVSYLLLGAVSGAIGQGVDHVGAIAGAGRLAAVVGGALMVVWGGTTLLATLGVRVPQPVPPRRLQATLTSLLVRFRNQSATLRGAATGLLTTLLPCGWLYVFVAIAGGTGHVGRAMLVMLAFWLGTLPMMVTLGLGARRFFGTFERRLPLAAAGMAVVLGLLTMAGRITTSSIRHPRHATEMVHDGR
jgi:sulfite exporter TauE/SafE